MESGRLPAGMRRPDRVRTDNSTTCPMDKTPLDISTDQSEACTRTCEVTVANAQGLHARPADLVAREARRWQSRIEFVGNSQRADGRSILDLLSLAAAQGTRLVIEATGPDAEEAIASIGRLFEENFQE
jgi:phosphocarrier protein HPr